MGKNEALVAHHTSTYYSSQSLVANSTSRFKYFPQNKIENDNNWNAFSGTILLEFSIGRDLGALQGLNDIPDNIVLKSMMLIFLSFFFSFFRITSITFFFPLSNLYIGLISWVARGVGINSRFQLSLETYSPVRAFYARTMTSDVTIIIFGGCTTCFDYHLHVYHVWFAVFFPGIFFHSRVTEACPVTTDLIMRVNVRSTGIIYQIKICTSSQRSLGGTYFSGGAHPAS